MFTNNKEILLEDIKAVRVLLDKFERYLNGSKEEFKWFEKEDLAVICGFDNEEIDEIFSMMKN